jgi:hypothetical protein
MRPEMVMRRAWYLLGLPVATLLGALGCANPDAHLRPPKHPEEFTVPPENDPRFAQPVSYPKSSLFQDMIHKPDTDPATPGGAGMRGPGMGGAGMH